MGTSACLAYIDPVTGALLLQGLLAGILSVGIAFRKTLSNVFRRLTGKGPAPTTEGNASDIAGAQE
jgi:hypothetical protein